MGKTGKRRCSFCGGTPVSREHVWPQWLKETPGGREAHENRRYDAGDYDIWTAAIRNGQPTFMTEPRRLMPTLDITVKAVCKPCNNGWMSNLEHQAKPLLIGLMEGRSLDADEARVVRRWVLKTTAMFEFNHTPSRSFSREVLAGIRDDVTPPGRWWAWAFNASEDCRFRLSHYGGTMNGYTSDLTQKARIGAVGDMILGMDRVGFLVRHTTAHGHGTNLSRTLWPVTHLLAPLGEGAPLSLPHGDVSTEMWNDMLPGRPYGIPFRTRPGERPGVGRR